MSDALYAIDFYKAGHIRQYPPGTELVYSNLTARSSKLFPIKDIPGIMFFGLQPFIFEFLTDEWGRFFDSDRDHTVQKYKAFLDQALGADHDVSHIAALWDLGYLPIRLKALPEGTLVPIGVPLLTIENTKPEFFWLTNYLETALSAYLWKPIVNATTAMAYRGLCEAAADWSLGADGGKNYVEYQCHDFSARGMSGIEDAARSGAAHLLFFKGTDNVPAMRFIEKCYGADLEGFGSVPATEHSVMCMGGPDGEIDTFRRLITETYPSGILSIVSDTWDLWRVLTEFMPAMKDDILARDGKIVIRPDSGDPVKIVCGDPEAPEGSPERRGAVKLLGDVFGYVENGGRLKNLNPKVGVIYGDSITPQRAASIIRRLFEDGVAADCIVFGVGSYTYQMVTRDSLGLAVKATFGIVNGEPRQIFKAPKTDSGTKRSLRGRVSVKRDDIGRLFVVDGLAAEDPDSLLRVVFEDGKIYNAEPFSVIRDRARAALEAPFW